MSKTTWVCISCGHVLGDLYGQELAPRGDVQLKTQGSNLVITCPECGTRKIWFPADAVVRVMKQLIDVIASETARAAVRAVQQELSLVRRENSKAIGERDEQ